MDRMQGPQESRRSIGAKMTAAVPLSELLHITWSSLFNYWAQFATPEVPLDSSPVTSEDLDRVRRGRVLSIVLGAAVTGDAIVIIITLAQIASLQSLTTISNLIAAIVLAFLWVLCARLNRTGRVEAAAVLTAGVLVGCLTIDLVVGDVLLGGYNWTDPPGWDLMAVGLLIVSLTLRPAIGWLCYFLYMGILLGIVTIVPHDSSTLPSAIGGGLVSATAPAWQQSLYLVIALIYRPAILGAVLTLIGQGANYFAMEALRERDHAQEIAENQQRVILESEVVARERRLQEQWMNECIANLKNSLNRDAPFIEPALSDSWRTNQNLLVFHSLLTTVIRRLQEGQKASCAIELLHAHVVKLPGLLRYLRASGDWFDRPVHENEYVLVTQLGERTGSGPVDSLLTDMNFYFDMLAREESDALSELLTAIAEFRTGNLARRVDPRFVTQRYGSFVHAVNALLDHVVSGPLTAPSVPFASAELDSSD